MSVVSRRYKVGGWKPYSGVSRLRKNKSMAAEKAANARPPPKAAFGPEFRARIPPEMKPAPTEL